jgi:hypothetical protein
VFFAPEAQASAPVNRRQMKLSPRGECDFLVALRAKADQIGTFGVHPIFAILSLHGCRRNRSLHDILAFPCAVAAADDPVGGVTLGAAERSRRTVTGGGAANELSRTVAGLPSSA